MTAKKYGRWFLNGLEVPEVGFATAWIHLESVMLSEISQVVKDKHHMISPINGT